MNEEKLVAKIRKTCRQAANYLAKHQADLDIKCIVAIALDAPNFNEQTCRTLYIYRALLCSLPFHGTYPDLDGNNPGLNPRDEPKRSIITDLDALLGEVMIRRCHRWMDMLPSSE